MFSKLRLSLIPLGIFLCSLLFAGTARAEGHSPRTETIKIDSFTVEKEFTSPEVNSTFAFNSVAFSWNDESKKEHELELYMRFYDDKWTDWYEADPIIDYKDGTEGFGKDAFMITAPVKKIQYKFESESGIKVENLKITFFNADGENSNADSGRNLKNGKSENGFLAYLSDFNLLASTNLPSAVKIISRAQWGADESKRILNKDAGPQITPQEDSNEEYLKFKDELKVVRKVTKDDNGKELRWPLEYPEKIKKIVLHHTATTDEALVASTGKSSKQNYESIVQNIYHYHAITRGWGDIGYHYLIDPDGRIYEGRYGEAVGAHVAGYNHGSLGIAVIGNYENNELPPAMLNSIVQISANRAGKYNIKADGKSSFRGEISHNIVGHRDYTATTCPGANLYKMIPQIRKMVASVNADPRANVDYEFIEVSDVYAEDFKREETKKVTLKLKNIGRKAWGSGTYLALNPDSKNQQFFDFPDAGGLKFAVMAENTVLPGRIASFQFVVRAKNISGMAELSLTPFIKVGSVSNKIDHQIYFPLFVTEPIYTYTVVDKELPPKTIRNGQLVRAWIDIKNTGNVTWSKFHNAISIGADRPRDRKSSFVRSGPFTRMAHMRENEVKPGQTVRFYFDLKAPEQAGLYREYFTPVVEGVTWMQDQKLNFTSYVYENPYSGVTSGLSGDHTFSTSKTETIQFKLKNVGGVVWKTYGYNQVKINVESGKGVQVTRTIIPKVEVEPGNEMEITMQVKANALATDGVLTITPTVAGQKLLRMPQRFYYRIGKAGSSGSSGAVSYNETSKYSQSNSSTISASDNDIRIKLSFGEKPMISSKGGMSLYSKNQKITDYKAGEKVEVNYQSGAYRVKQGSSTRALSNPPRFLAKNGGVLEISNMQRRPGWNQTLNDNEFRGVLEVILDSGKLVTVNELDLEDYLKGLAENLNTENIEKMKALTVAARTYATYYMTVAKKFPGKPWHLDDDPAVSQKYLGYGYEKRAPRVAQAVNDTQGEVITYQDKLIKTPYFSQSDGRTRSAKEVWGWNDTPYLQSVTDSYCKATELLGHGVGLSGCGARGLADAGKNYKEILKFFYTGIEIGRQSL